LEDRFVSWLDYTLAPEGEIWRFEPSIEMRNWAQGL
jgi:hypothetical protein